MPGTTLRTTELDLCVGVAIGGIQRRPDGSIGETSVSVFHLLPDVPRSGLEIARKIFELRRAGFEVDAYVAGGDGTVRAGQNARSAVEGMLEGMDVPFHSSAPSDGLVSQFLSATIQEDGHIQYQTERADYSWKLYRSTRG